MNLREIMFARRNTSPRLPLWRSTALVMALAAMFLAACGTDGDTSSGEEESQTAPSEADATTSDESDDTADDPAAGEDEAAVDLTADGEPRPINIGILGGTQEVLLNVMREQGFDKKYNLELEVSEMASPPALHVAISEGAVDAGFGSPPTLAIARDGGRDVVVFRVLIGVDNMVLAPQDSPVETLADLEGERWGSFTSRSGLLVQVLQAIVMEKHGFNPLSDAELVEVPGPALGGLMNQGELAAGLMSGGVEGVRIYLEGGYKIVADLAEEYEQLFDTTRPYHVGVASTESYIEENTETIVALNAALTDTLEYIESTPEVWESVAEFYEMEDERAVELLQERVGPTFLTEWDEEALEAQMKLLELLIEVAPPGEFIDEIPDGLYRLDLQPGRWTGG